MRRVVCASPAYISAHGAPAAPGDLSQHRCVTFSGPSATDRWVFDANGGEVSGAIHSRLVVNTAEAAIDAAKAGLGLTRVLSYQIATALADCRLVPVLQPFAPAPVPVSLVFDAQGALPLKLRAFLDFAGPRLRARLSSETSKR